MLAEFNSKSKDQTTEQSLFQAKLAWMLQSACDLYLSLQKLLWKCFSKADAQNILLAQIRPNRTVNVLHSCHRNPLAKPTIHNTIWQTFCSWLLFCRKATWKTDKRFLSEWSTIIQSGMKAIISINISYVYEHP